MGREVTVEGKWLSPHGCPEWTGDSGTWVLGEWATRCSGDKKGVPPGPPELGDGAPPCEAGRRAWRGGGVGWGGRDARLLHSEPLCVRFLQRTQLTLPSSFQRPKQPIGGGAGPARLRASPRLRLPSPRGRLRSRQAEQPSRKLGAATPGCGKGAGSQEAHQAPTAHLSTRLGGRAGIWSPQGPRGLALRAGPEARRSAPATGHRGLDASARPHRFLQARRDRWPLRALQPPRGPTLPPPPAAPCPRPEAQGAAHPQLGGTVSCSRREQAAPLRPSCSPTPHGGRGNAGTPRR